MTDSPEFAIVEQAPDSVGTMKASAAQLLVLSANTETAVEQAAGQLREFLESQPSASLGDVAQTLQYGRRAFQSRRALVAAERDEAIKALSDVARLSKGLAGAFGRRPVIFLLPGVGDHYVGMAHGLYESWTTFRSDIDRCAEILQPHLGVDIREVLYPKSGRWRHTEHGGIDFRKMLGRRGDAPLDPEVVRLNDVRFTQPALFSIEYAVARLWQSWGIAPDALVPHSMGEYVAACLAGVLSLEDALRLTAKRAALVHSLPEGAMLAVTLPESELRPSLPPGVSIALINGPRLCVVAGASEAVSDLERHFASAGIVTRRVRNSHAFHSHMLDPIVDQLEAEVARVTLRAPQIPYVSSVTGTWIRSADATNPRYWGQQASRTVRFSDALQTLWTHEHPVLIEVGAGRTLGVLAMQHPDGTSKECVTVASVRHEYDRASDASFILQSVGKVWCAGVDLDWQRGRGGQPHREIALPAFPFEREEDGGRPEPDASGAGHDLQHVPVNGDDLCGVRETSESVAESPLHVVTQSAGGIQDCQDQSVFNGRSNEPRLPRTSTELALDEIWREVLGTDESDIDASFFDLGGHSLLAVSLFVSIEKRFGRRLPLSVLFERPTVAKLAQVLDSDATTPDTTVVLIKGGTKRPFFCVHGVGGELLSFKRLVSGLSESQPFYGIQWVNNIDDVEFPTVEALAARYVKAMRRCQPDGPYLIGGYCSGSMIAWEMAQQLQAAQQEVGLVVIIDYLSPIGVARPWLTPFLQNVPYWLRDDFLRSGVGELRSRARGKLRLLIDRSIGLLPGHARVRSDIRDALGMWNAGEDRIRFIEGHYRQHLAYKPPPYSGAVSIFRARAQPLLSSHRAPEVGWSSSVAGRTRVHMIPGSHSNILHDPGVRHLAVGLQADLDAACAQVPSSDVHPHAVAI